MKYSYNEILYPWYPEEFKIINFGNIKKDMYSISNYGRVFNIRTNKELSIFKGNGYCNVALQNYDNSRSVYYVHILVAHHFIPKTDDDIRNDRIYVNHRNLNRSNNYVHNLEWVNYEENNKHAAEFGHLKLNTEIVKRISNTTWGDSGAIGSKNGMARLNEDQVHMICKMLEEGHSYKDICLKVDGLEDTENDRHLITNIVRGKRWNQISEKYNLPKPKPCTDYSDYVIPVCELLEKNYSTTDIINILNMDNTKDRARGFINRIKRKASYQEITKNYNF